jgi:hypothetical protein
MTGARADCYSAAPMALRDVILSGPDLLGDAAEVFACLAVNSAMNARAAIATS